jgi:hypothetical protein
LPALCSCRLNEWCAARFFLAAHPPWLLANRHFGALYVVAFIVIHLAFTAVAISKHHVPKARADAKPVGDRERYKFLEDEPYKDDEEPWTRRIDTASCWSWKDRGTVHVELSHLPERNGSGDDSVGSKSGEVATEVKELKAKTEEMHGKMSTLIAWLYLKSTSEQPSCTMPPAETAPALAPVAAARAPEQDAGASPRLRARQMSTLI